MKQDETGDTDYLLRSSTKRIIAASMSIASHLSSAHISRGQSRHKDQVRTSAPSPPPLHAMMGLFDHPSPGLVVHQRYMTLNLDPTSDTYGQHCHFESDTPDEEGRLQLGAQRTPSGQKARNAFLWGPIPAAGWMFSSGDLMDTILGIYDVAQGYVESTEELLNLAGGALRSAVTARRETLSANGIPFDDAALYNMPLWQEIASVYFQLSTRITYLRQIQALLAACNLPYISERGDNAEIMEAVFELRDDLTERWYTPLKEAVRIGREFKQRGNDAMTSVPRVASQAIPMYIRAIKQILPWFPSDHYMAPWEARKNGIGSLCNINLAIALIGGFQLFKTAYHILEEVSGLSCVTNWEKAKILHWQGRCVMAMNSFAVTNDCEWAVYPDVITKTAPSIEKERDYYLARPRGGLANRSPWEDFSPDAFEEHYAAFTRRCPPPKQSWWDRLNTDAAINVHRWMTRMKFLQHVGLVENKFGSEEPCTDLEDANGRLEKTGTTAEWDYEVEA